MDEFADGGGRRLVGFTVVELLIALAVIGVLLGVAVVALRPPSSRLAADDFQALLQEARMEAIRRNRPVSITVDVADGAVLVQASEETSNVSCQGGQVEIQRLDLTEYRGVAVATTMPDARMLWLPNGRSQRCNGGLMSSSTTFDNDRAAYAVEVSAAGQVKVVKQ